MAIYINGVKLKKTQYGLKFSGKTEDFIKQLKQHTGDKGYFNLEIKERRDPGKYGDTHYLVVDEWKPTEKFPKKETYVSDKHEYVSPEYVKAEYVKPVRDNNEELPF